MEDEKWRAVRMGLEWSAVKIREAVDHSTGRVGVRSRRGWNCHQSASHSVSCLSLVLDVASMN